MTVTEICQFLRGLPMEDYSTSDLIRIKWAAESLVDQIRRERETRDARAVDEACTLENKDIRDIA